MWVPEYVGVRTKEAADRAAKEALGKEPRDNFLPFSDLEPLTAKYIHQVWQKEWDEAVLASRKLHEIKPKLPRSGELRTHRLRSHLLKTQSLKVLPLKSGVGQYIAIYTTVTAGDFFLAHFYPSGPFTCIFSKTSPEGFVLC